MKLFPGVEATDSERAAPRPGDDLVAAADVVMDRAFTVPGSPETVWPWLLQLGKRRAGWYFPRSVELVIPSARRGLREIDPQWQQLTVGDVIPDYGGSAATFEVAQISAPTTLVYRSDRGRTKLTWAIVLEPIGGSTRVFLRLRLAPVAHRRMAEIFGGCFDLLTIAGMAAGLRERLAKARGDR